MTCDQGHSVGGNGSDGYLVTCMQGAEWSPWQPCLSESTAKTRVIGFDFRRGISPTLKILLTVFKVESAAEVDLLLYWL